MIKCIIFDMDGLMIDSVVVEPIWHKVETRVFGHLGVELDLAACLETTGLRVDEMVRHHWEKRPWKDGTSLEQVAEMIINGMVEELKRDPKPMPGLMHALDFFQKEKGLPLAVASSSPEPLIHAALEGLGVKDRFQVICSAVSEKFGKPHPSVYISAAEKCNVSPTDCLALEDSLNGAISAKAGRLKVIAIPDRNHVEPSGFLRFSFCDQIIWSLENLNEELWEKLNG